jgi:hypothetical protein
LTNRLDVLEEAMVSNSSKAVDSLDEMKQASSSREKIVDYSLDKMEERMSEMYRKMDDMGARMVVLEDENRILKGVWVCRCD